MVVVVQLEAVIAMQMTQMRMATPQVLLGVAVQLFVLTVLPCLLTALVAKVQAQVQLQLEHALRARTQVLAASLLVASHQRLLVEQEEKVLVCVAAA